jgi:hypothetical protein
MIVKYLVGVAGANMEAAMHNGWTPLHLYMLPAGGVTWPLFATWFIRLPVPV